VSSDKYLSLFQAQELKFSSRTFFKQSRKRARIVNVPPPTDAPHLEEGQADGLPLFYCSGKPRKQPIHILL
jgi:hypothetical protein